MKYAVLIQRSIHIPGDERSRTNPGHGYPAYEQGYTEFRSFESEEAFKYYVTKASKYERFKAIRYEDVKFSTSIKVEVA